MKSIKKNYIYNLTYQILALMAPLITTPYVSRVLGAEAIGEYSYAYSIVYYFMLAAILGTATYAEREISFCQDDRTKRSARFWDLLFLRNITSVASALVYGLMVGLCFNNKLMAAIVALNIVSVGLDTVWLFQGMEEFGRITLRDTCIKLLTIASIFLFIKRTEDIYLYALIMSLSPVVSAVSLLPFLHRYIDKIRIKEVRPFYDLKSIIGLFIPTIAISVYAMLDKTMLGIFTTTKVENGYYEQATKLSKTALTVVTSLGTVMIPRISYYFEKKQTKLINEYALSQLYSKPVTEDDDTLDYIPTQYIAEFVKRIGYDGIVFKSSLYNDENSVNVVIFNFDKCEAVGSVVYDVTRNDYTCEMEDPVSELRLNFQLQLTPDNN